MAVPGILPDEAVKRYAQLLDRAVKMTKQETARESFIDYVKYVWPGFVSGRHHKIVADKLERVARGELKRLIINMPPRHSKSEFSSYLFPSWFIGRMPTKKIMQATHTADLSVRFGRKVRNLMDGEDYHQVFPKVKLRADSKAAYRWETDDGGEYYAAGVGSNIAGRGADLFIVDDPPSEQDAQSLTALDAAGDGNMSGPRQRLQPGGIHHRSHRLRRTRLRARWPRNRRRSRDILPVSCAVARRTTGWPVNGRWRRTRRQRQCFACCRFAYPPAGHR